MPYPLTELIIAAPRPTPLTTAHRLAGGIAGALRMARALATAGRAIDLAGLEDSVGLLCAKSLDLAPAEGREIRETLIAVLQELDTLGDVLQARTDSETAPS